MAAASQDSEEGIHSINITPLVDIFLVLLIIVMITSTLIEHGQINVEVPTAAQAGSAAPSASGLVMDAEERLFLDGRYLDSLSVLQSLREAVQLDAQHQVLVSAHRDLRYQKVIEVLDIVKEAGVSQYALKVIRAE